MGSKLVTRWAQCPTGGVTLDNIKRTPELRPGGDVDGAGRLIEQQELRPWSLRGWLLCKMSGLDFEEHVLDNDDPDTRAELLLLSSSFLVPRLVHDGVTVWDTMAIGEYLNEVRPDAGLLPDDRVARRRALPGGVRRDPLRLREPARRRCP